jgi:hypothetical protein
MELNTTAITQITDEPSQPVTISSSCRRRSRSVQSQFDRKKVSHPHAFNSLCPILTSSPILLAARRSIKQGGLDG